VKKLLLVVTPVKTGVQAILNRLKSRSERDWIPAFAGMTGKIASRFLDSFGEGGEGRLYLQRDER
jgi:hypothetical protein